MAKMQFNGITPSPFPSYYTGSFDLTEHDKTSATYVTEDFRDVQVNGSFKYAADGESVKSGTVTGVGFLGTGAPLGQISGLSLDAAKLDLLLQTKTMASAMPYLLKGNDKVFGSEMSDHMMGYAGNDKITGKAGYDVIEGGAGNDRLTGGADPDTFLFLGNKFGRDIIVDFEVGIDEIAAGLAVQRMRQVGDDTVVFFGGGSQITFLDVRKNELSADDF